MPVGCGADPPPSLRCSSPPSPSCIRRSLPRASQCVAKSTALHCRPPACLSLGPCRLQDEGRFGLFANPAGLRTKAARGWWGTLKAGLGLGRNANVTLAAFPLHSALTASNVLGQGGQQAALLRELQELGVADDRTLVMLHLVVERWAALSFDRSAFFGVGGVCVCGGGGGGGAY
jgi:hypothetical protein